MIENLLNSIQNFMNNHKLAIHDEKPWKQTLKIKWSVLQMHRKGSNKSHSKTNHEAIRNLGGGRSRGGWISPGSPSWPQAAILSSPLLDLIKTTHPPSARMLRNSIISSSLVGLNWDPWWGLKVSRFILQGIPRTSSIILVASSLLLSKCRWIILGWRLCILGSTSKIINKDSNYKYLKDMVVLAIMLHNCSKQDLISGAKDTGAACYVSDWMRGFRSKFIGC